MEALAALALACNILENIDRACKYVKKIKEIYESASGQSADHENLSEVVKNMTQVVEEFKELQAQVPQSNADYAMERIAKKGLDVSTKINAMLAECLPKTGKSVASAIKAAIRARLKKSELDALEERLRKNSESLNHFVVARTLREIGAVRQSCNGLDANINLIRAQQQSSEKALDAITKELEALGLTSTTLSSQFRGIINSVDQATNDVKTAAALQALHFGTMYRRFNEVSESEVGTFEWIFKDPNRQLQEQPGLDISFPDWLRTGQGVFHIAGKPGSGKSTLMKFICQHPDVDHLLKEWAGSKELMSAQFFFWKIGTAEQKGLAGLIRGLLFAIIEKEPVLAKTLFPDFWLPKRHRSSLNPLTDREVTDALDIVTKDLELLQKYRICFFIDALDEYEPQRGSTHWLLVNKILQWTSKSNGNVKVCVSSREEPVFEKFFLSNQRITIHFFTKPDIEELVRLRLVENEQFSALQQNHKKRCDRIVKMVKDQAEGVFLWVVLLLAQFEESLNEDDGIHALEGILERAPTELQDFFASILHSIPQRYREASYTILAIVMRFHGILLNSPESVLFDGLTPITLLTLAHTWWLFEINDRSGLTKLPTDILWHNDHKDMCRADDSVMKFANKVKSRCRGLLTCPDLCDGSSSELVFTHRSIPEALKEVFSQLAASFQLDDYLVVERWVWACLVSSKYKSDTNMRSSHAALEALAACRQNRWNSRIPCRTFQMLHLMERLFLDEDDPSPFLVLVAAANLGLYEYVSWALKEYPAFYKKFLPSAFAHYLYLQMDTEVHKTHRYAEVEIISLFLDHGPGPNTAYGFDDALCLEFNETAHPPSYHGYILPMTFWYYWLVFYLSLDCHESWGSGLGSTEWELEFLVETLDFRRGHWSLRWETLEFWLKHNVDPDVTFHSHVSADHGAIVDDSASEYLKRGDLQEDSTGEFGGEHSPDRFSLQVCSTDGVVYEWHWSGADKSGYDDEKWPRSLRLFMERCGKDSMTLAEFVNLREPPNKDELIRLIHQNRRLKKDTTGPTMAQPDKMKFEGPSTEPSNENRISGDEEDSGSSITNSNPRNTPSVGGHKRKRSEDVHHRELVPSARSANKRKESLTPGLHS
ncbi:hypothetical protein QBC40DRAFT_269162 [Triangularia verruculosa]|uniref:Nephrocystin 3-like N-terminal domain-containing protein n=1 Tax=Triangularia verruculosa TaxID=2587418 RepID=A0AAN6X7M0_9PEZI|nr:hypothetical protein QBC40DRAFT_269162 [Triangularia verruculosa]